MKTMPTSCQPNVPTLALSGAALYEAAEKKILANKTAGHWQPAEGKHKHTHHCSQSRRFLRQPSEIFHVIADDSSPAHADDYAEGAHIHERVDQEINY